MTGFAQAFIDSFRTMREFRCAKCRRLLAKEWIIVGRLEILCRCGHLNRHLWKKPKSDKIKA